MREWKELVGVDRKGAVERSAVAVEHTPESLFPRLLYGRTCTLRLPAYTSASTPAMDDWIKLSRQRRMNTVTQGKNNKESRKLPRSVFNLRFAIAYLLPLLEQRFRNIDRPFRAQKLDIPSKVKHSLMPLLTHQQGLTDSNTFPVCVFPFASILTVLLQSLLSSNSYPEACEY